MVPLGAPAWLQATLPNENLSPFNKTYAGTGYRWRHQRPCSRRCFLGPRETKLKNGGSDEATRSAFCIVTQGIFDKETIISVKIPVIETLPDLRLIKSTDW